MSYKPEVQTDITGTWTSNTLRFATEAEATTYIHDLEMRWSSVRGTRVVSSDDPVNYVVRNGKAVPL